MCNLNIFCKAKEGTCACGESNCEGIYKPVPVALHPPPESAMILSLFNLINNQNQFIKKIIQDTKQANEKLDQLFLNIGGQKAVLETNSDESATCDQLTRILSPENVSFEFSLQLVSELPNPAYKERGFSILLQIVDCQGQKVILPNPVSFHVLLFTTESPPKLMKTNTGGDKIMRGTIEADGNSTVLFRKVVIKEVTSHFRNGCFFLVVAPKHQNNVQPLIIPDFVIKARKVNCEEATKKKIKIHESENPIIAGSE